jgi:glycosyltransferase involved in cell wall biosynthesis
MSRPLRVVVCLPQTPFEDGGAEILSRRLVAALAARGHEADLVTVPFKWYPSRTLLENALAWRMLDLNEANGRPIDAVICTKFPSYLVRHPRKIVWLFHQFRQAYDMHGTPFAQFADDPEGSAMREAILRMDRLAFDEARGLFAISGNVAGRLERFCRRTATVLPPPPQDLRLAPLGDDGYILSVGRLDAAKRVDVMIRALADAPGVRAVVVGHGPERDALEAVAREAGVAGRVEFRGRVGEDELSDLYGRARAVYYAPHDEDYGFVTVEAQLAGRAVVTTTDAGGPLDFVRDGATGLVVEPSAEAVGGAISRLAGDADLARRLGAAAREEVRTLSWDEIIDTLLAPA